MLQQIIIRGNARIATIQAVGQEQFSTIVVFRIVSRAMQEMPHQSIIRINAQPAMTQTPGLEVTLITQLSRIAYPAI